MRLQQAVVAAGISFSVFGGNMPGDVCTSPEDKNKIRSHRYEYEEEQYESF